MAEKTSGYDGEIDWEAEIIAAARRAAAALTSAV